MRSGRQLARRLIPALLVMVFCCQCETVRTVKSTRSSGYKFAGINDHELESNKSEGADRIQNYREKSIKNSDGEVVRTEKKGELYQDRAAVTAKEKGRSYQGLKKASFRREQVATKEFKTPEYLQRQEYTGTKTFNTRSARESGSEAGNLMDRLFKTDSSSASTLAAGENGTVARQSGKRFLTKSDPVARRAMENAAIPEDTPSAGYRENVMMSMDDVKKLVNPGSDRPSS